MSASSVSVRKIPQIRIGATVGRACEDTETLRPLILADVDAFRLNFPHGDCD